MLRRNVHWARVPFTRRALLQACSALGLTAALPPRMSWSADGNVLRIRDYANVSTIDPPFFTGVNDAQVMDCVHNKLIHYKPGRTWDWELEAAESIEQADKTSIRFRLRPGIAFTNGFGEMTAEDVKFSFERVVDPTTESPIRPDWGPLDRVEVTDKYSGVIVFKEPFQPVWMITLPYGAGNIVSKKAVEPEFKNSNFGMEPPCVSGPYVLKEWRPKERTVLARNPEWTLEKPDFDEIHIFPIDDEKTAEVAFEAGDVEFTRISLSSLERYKENPPANSTVREHPSLYYVWVGMNMEHPKLKDKRVRQAVQHAIDVPAVLEAAYFGLAEPSTGIIAPGLVGHRGKNVAPPSGDIEKARQLLAEAGHPNGIDLELDVLNKATNVTAAQVIQATAAAAGINIQINLHESGAFWSLGFEEEGDRWQEVQLILNRFSMTPDPYYATAWFICEQVGVWNWERFCNEEFDRLHEAAKGETDLEKRAEMYQRMQTMMEESGAYRFLTHEATPVIYRNTIEPALRPDGIPLLRYFEKA